MQVIHGELRVDGKSSSTADVVFSQPVSQVVVVLSGFKTDSPSGLQLTSLEVQVGVEQPALLPSVHARICGKLSVQTSGLRRVSHEHDRNNVRGSLTYTALGW